MNIKELFEKDIHRNINGVIKVGQQDRENVRQELDEYVVTQQLERHFNTFFDRYTNSLDTPTDKMGVWISGFFGSGKSHFLKILSYLLENVSIEQQQAIDFFDEKRVPDPLLRASMTRAVQGSTDVILFNIDSKAEANSKNQRDSIVRVFQKVFDDYLGYFGSVPAIAEFERTLDQKGQYQTFKQAFAGASGSTWEEDRDAWLFHQEDISRALEVSTGMGIDAANRSAYPFIPYQFNLLQAVFTQIRVMGSAGKHLASGERSLLDAFQIAAQTVADESIGTLVPFHTFYLAIEGFLDSSISQAINQAKQNSQLQDFDVERF